MLCSSPGMESLNGDLKYPSDCYSPKFSDMHRTGMGLGLISSIKSEPWPAALGLSSPSSVGNSGYGYAGGYVDHHSSMAALHGSGATMGSPGHHQ
eukprot:maker-scaffold63_size435493-snap-gene-2.17 protein:Tk00828 transcript:maker-scaffold63_size435493-snap-gene-2.17-mRNA-1 annotation:"---NA---"